MSSAQLQANIWKFYLFRVFGVAINVATPVIVLFWQENGLSLTEVMVLQSLYSVFLVLFEVPSGYLADVIGRKKIFIWGSFFNLLAIVIYIFSHSFAAFLLAEGALAISLSLLSGADSAFLYDTLKQLKREHEYKKIWGRKVFYALISTAVLGIAGAYIASFDIRWPWIAALVPVSLMILMSWTFTEPERHKLIYKQGYLKTLIEIMYKDIFQKTKLRWLILYSGLIFMMYHSAFWFYQPLFDVTGVDVKFFGLIFTVFYGVAAIVSRYAHNIEAYFGKRRILISLALLNALGLLLLGNVLFVFTFIFIIIHAFVRGMYSVVISDYINQLTESSIRATVLSAQNLIARLLFAIAVPLIGVLADVYSVPQALNIMGITILVAGGSMLFILRRYKLV